MAEPVPPCVILNEPQLAENIGAVARVMANFGLFDLRMVRPRDGWPQERAWACASGADWPLDNARVFATLEEAIADLQLLYATTARPRELHLPVITPREAAANLRAASEGGQKIGLLYGGERAGLETHDIALAQAVVTSPIDPKFRSLNLAQAVAVGDLCRRFADEGVWVRPMGKVVYLTPALTIDADDLDALCAAVVKGLHGVAGAAGR